MGRCETCHNEYDKSFEVVMAGGRYTFDSFECAIHALAPVCNHCGCRIVGHGVEIKGRMFCCAHCAKHTCGVENCTGESGDKEKGLEGINDRLD